MLVTQRMVPLTVHGRQLHQIGLPYHWGPNGYTTGDAANELAHLSLDPNVHIQEVKAIDLRHPPRTATARAGPARVRARLPGPGRDHRSDRDGAVK